MKGDCWRPAVADLGLVVIVVVTVGTGWRSREVPVTGPAVARREAVLGAAYPKTLVSSDGEQTVLPAPPARILSTTLALDEILLALVPPSRVVGVSVYALDPAVSNVVQTARAVPHAIRSEVETMVSLEPDLALLAEFTAREVVELLQGAGIPVFRLRHFDSIADIRQNVRLLGAAVGAEASAERIVAQMDQTMDRVHRTLGPEVRRLRVLQYSPGGFTAGTGTLQDELIERAGGRNVAVEAGIVGYGTLASEMAIALDPDVILLAGYAPPGTEAPDSAGFILQDPAWRDVRAVQNRRIVVIPARYLSAVSQHVAQAVEALARGLYPDRFATVAPAGDTTAETANHNVRGCAPLLRYPRAVLLPLAVRPGHDQRRMPRGRPAAFKRVPAVPAVATRVTIRGASPQHSQGCGGCSGCCGLSLWRTAESGDRHRSFWMFPIANDSFCQRRESFFTALNSPRRWKASVHD